jgi:peptide/nickel transport system substrate-binding protein
VNRLRRALIVAPALALALGVAACSGASTIPAAVNSGAAGGTGTGGAGSAAPAKGGSLTVLVVAGGLATWPNLDPLASGTANADYRNAVFGEMFHQDADASVVPALAQGVTTSADGKTITITLRPGVKFSDGTPLNAAAVVTNYQRDLDPANACQCIGTFRGVKSVAASGDGSVVLTLAAPMPAFTAAVVDSALNWIASPAALTKEGKNFGTAPVGAGPFTVTSDDPSQKLVLAANPGYYVKGEPSLSQLTFQSVGNDQSAYAALQSGTAQLVEGITTQQLLTQAKSSFSVTPLPVTSVYQTTYNTLAPPLNNPKAREALAYATDAKALDSGLFGGQYKLDQIPVASDASFYQASVPGYKGYDLDKAKALVKQLGGLTVSMQGSPAGAGGELMQALQSMWAKAGIKVSKISQLALPQLTANFTSHNWQVDVGFSGASDPALGLGLQFFFGSHGPDSGVADPALDALLLTGATSLNQADRSAAYKSAYQLMWANTYGDFLFENPSFNVSTASVSGVGPTPARWIDWGQVAVK